MPPPTLDEGPHLDYAGQWFIFATLTIIVYPLLLRRTARHKASEKAEAEHDAAAEHDRSRADGSRRAGRTGSPGESGTTATLCRARPREPGRPRAAVDTRTRILEAAVTCIERWGLAKTSLEDVANEAGLSRATVYRYFAGGRDELVAETIAWEVAVLRPAGRRGRARGGIEDKLVRGLVFGHQAIDDHLLLQRVLSTEPEVFLADFQPAHAGDGRARAGRGRPAAGRRAAAAGARRRTRPPATSPACSSPTSAARGSGTSPPSRRSTGWCAPSSWPASWRTPEA